jgi:hypothetical protein
MIAASRAADSVGLQIFIGVAVLLIAGLIGWATKTLLKHQADTAAELRVHDEERTKDMQEVKAMLGEAYDALITKRPSPTDPRPRKGLLDRFDLLWDSHEEVKRTVERLDGRSTLIRQDTKALVKDSEANKGSMTRDAVDRVEAGNVRIEDEQTRVREQLTERESHHDDEPGHTHTS